MKNLSLYIVLLLLALNINAQQSGDLDTTFGKAELTNGDSSRFNNGVKKLIIQPDGNILAGCSFTLYNNVSFPYLIRLDQYDLPDSGFHLGLFDGNRREYI